MRLIGWTENLLVYFESDDFFCEERASLSRIRDIEKKEVISLWKSDALYLTNYGIGILTEESIALHLSGRIVPKARPRGTSSHYYMPSAYRNWKQDAISCFQSQTTERNLSGVFVEVTLLGKHRESADSDNLIGSIFDALVQSKILANDNLKHLRGHEFIYKPSKELPTVQIIIRKLKK